jgi:hypothetical protein
MPLVHDRPDINPGLHALIIGISRYPHLPDLGSVPDERSFGHQSLTAAASSAFAAHVVLRCRTYPFSSTDAPRSTLHSKRRLGAKGRLRLSQTGACGGSAHPHPQAGQ